MRLPDAHLRYGRRMSVDREDQRLVTNEPGLPPGARGDNPEAPVEGGSSQGAADADESSGGSRGPSDASA